MPLGKENNQSIVVLYFDYLTMAKSHFKPIEEGLELLFDLNT